MNVAAMGMPKGFTIDDEIKRFFNWVFIWVFLANVGFMALWFVGAPPRWWEIGVIGFTGLIAKRFPFWARYVSFVAVITYSTLNFIGGMFNLSLASLAYSVQFFLELKPDSAIEYIAVGISILIILGVAFRLLRRDTNFSRSSLILAAAGLFFGLAAIDLQIGKGMRGHYQRFAPAGALFTSATNETKFIERADGKRNLVLVVVESLGLPATNAEMKRLLFRPYKDSEAVAARYDLSQGKTLYYNGTTAGEVRELCGHWRDYYELLDKADPNCIPAQLGRRGYDTIALNSFTETFFQTGKWYPNTGFKTRLFDKDLEKKGAQQCGGVFAGACDRDIPAQISEHLKKAKQPTFLYWLTVNSHLPVPPGLNLNVDNCARISAVIAREFPQICRQFSIWHDIDTAMVKQITADDFPNTDILIVGDHMPPYFDRHHRTQFDPEHVPYLYLRRKDGDEDSAKIASK